MIEGVGMRVETCADPFFYWKYFALCDAHHNGLGNRGAILLSVD